MNEDARVVHKLKKELGDKEQGINDIIKRGPFFSCNMKRRREVTQDFDSNTDVTWIGLRFTGITSASSPFYY